MKTFTPIYLGQGQNIILKGLQLMATSHLTKYLLLKSASYYFFHWNFAWKCPLSRVKS